ncbi:hypothetical protein C2S53_008807 [Perilla frutescens var. hirtella]|uniref:Retrovirus-related Pol polyprotein from transposon TNT 1-94 n=1 Tax=Perilla frutescens var. hirtella TaxID=608512 RepID=A0AAD4NZB5_PERFH|nr:hypothetical protein C2S53_008807 [Perilla frutescens var. hirtella]
MAPTIVELPYLQAMHIRLDRSNYAIWRMQILTTVRTHGFSEFLDNHKLLLAQFLPTSSTGHCVPNPDYQSKVRVMQLRFQLQITRKGDQSVDDYFLKMRSFVDLLAGAVSQLSDDELILYVLASLSPEYEAIIVNLTHCSDLLNLQEVHFVLQAQEQRLHNQSMMFSSIHVAYSHAFG